MAIALLVVGALAVRIWAEAAYRNFIARQPDEFQRRMANVDACMHF